MSWLRPARGCSCEGSSRNSEGFWMAVLGSKGVGWKLSSFTKSAFWGEAGAGAVSLDLRPVMESQLALD